MSFEWQSACGVLGFALIAGSYLLLQLGRINGCSPGYSAANAAGAALVIVSLLVDFNLAALLVEVLWLAISLFGLFTHGSRPLRGARAQDPLQQ